MEERNIKLTLAYDGTGFSGFQRQLNTNLTVQEKLENAIAKLAGEPISITGAGRTDAGVHAAGQVVNFRTRASIPVNKWPYALRGMLPDNIVVYKAEEVPMDFHARYSAVGKTYLYRIWRAEWPSVFQQRFSYHYPSVLDENAVWAAQTCFLGEHDFAAFASTGTPIKNTTRILSRLNIETTQDEWWIWVKGNGFLYHMVRNIVGSLLWVGEKKLGVDDIKAALSGDREITIGPTVPAIGLSLMEVEYKV